ncbi:PhzF family phenazine biosynthesis protein [Roseiterribacter gracilis]|uniref:Epimerase n=1 Tax=Roseiterribacter gracilis TaxID=2812848 RepID=A0A8S8X752_9PROT|nr:epimerase [Rhodospirillales bacterium TMPK1]
MATLVAGLIDVFADAPLQGNPLAVVEGGEGLAEDTLRRIAAEFNQAETTFLLPSTRADWRLRSFTASGVEVSGAGHNALGAWLWLGERGKLGDLSEPRTFQQEIGDDVLPIVLGRRDGRVHGRMRQAPLRLGAKLETVDALAASLGLRVDDVVLHPPPRTAETGAAHLMVRVRDPATVDRCVANADALVAQLRPVGAEGCYVYAFDPARPSAAYARFFNPTIGLWEDAATGTAAGPLAAYLASEKFIAADASLVIEQGVRMGRRSLLHVQLTPEPDLSGAGVIVFTGELHV